MKRTARASVRICMDQRGRWLGGDVTERFWRSPKHEDICLDAFEARSEARADGIGC